MKKIKFLLFVFTILCIILIDSSCKSKTENIPSTTVTDSSVTQSVSPAVISGNEDLKKGVADAVKDYPNVKAEVTDSVINLNGSIKRTDWQKLNPTLNTLHPKRINSTNLKIE